MATLVPVCDMNASAVFSGGINYAIRQNGWNYYLGSTVPGAYIFYYGTNSVCAFLPNGDGFTVGEGLRYTGGGGGQRFYTVNTTNTGGNVAHVTVDGVLYRAWVDGNHDPISRNPSIPVYETIPDGIRAIIGSIAYPITYHATNGTVTGPSEAAVGDTVTVSAVPDVGYGITDASTQILVTNDDVAVPYAWDATNQRITFTMPEGAATVSVTASLIPTYPITYRPTRVTLDGPATAAVGATVNVDCTFPEGYGVKTTDSITVTCNRVPVPFSWDAENQRITFTMPDPTGGGG